MTYLKTLDWIHSYKANGRRPDLNRMKALLTQCGNPQEQFPAIHVVGTNGKGSTSSFLQHVFTASGYKTGTFTSPFITRFNERIAVDGHEIVDHDLIATVSLVKSIIESPELLQTYGRPTEFEVVTLIMFVYFDQINPVDIAVIEAGIGGLKDSTNVFTALAVICTSISLDHQDVLGQTLAQIAEQKIGVLDPYVPFIFGKVEDSVSQVFHKTAAHLKAPTYQLGQDFSFLENGRAFDFVYQDVMISGIHLQMLGQHQQANASLAAMTSLLLAPQFPKVTQDSIKAGLEQTKWAGRTEMLSPNLMLDGAHNQDSVAKLVDLLRNDFADKRIHLLFAGLKRKPLDHMLSQLDDFEVSVCPFDFFEGLPLADYPPQYPKVNDFRDWLKQAQKSDDLYVVTGSLYFISQVRNYLIEEEKQGQ